MTESPASAEAVATARRLLGRERGDPSSVRGNLARALAEPVALLQSASPSAILTTCREPEAPARSAAFALMGHADTNDARAELTLLSRLASQCARAIRANDVAAAARLCRTQHDLLRHHAASCLTGLASSLMTSADRYRVLAGSTLERLLAEDLQHLGLPQLESL